MLCGSFRENDIEVTFFVGCICVLPVFAQVALPDADTAAQRMRRQDDLENFTYTIIDRYLEQPTADRLALFDTYEKQVWRPRVSPEEYLAYVILLCNKAYYTVRFGDLYHGAEAYEKAWKLYADDSLSGYDIIEYCLKPLGNTYSMLGDYSHAGNIVKSYLALAEREQNTAHILGALINLAIIYHDTGRYGEAIALLRQGALVQANAEKPGSYTEKARAALCRSGNQLSFAGRSGYGTPLGAAGAALYTAICSG